MKKTKTKKPHKKPAKRKQQRPKAKTSRGSASGSRKRTTTKKKVVKKATKKNKAFKRSVGRAGGIFPRLKKRLTAVKEGVGKFYKENKDTIRDATIIAAGLLSVPLIRYGAQRALESKALQKAWNDQLEKLKNIDWDDVRFKVKSLDPRLDPEEKIRAEAMQNARQTYWDLKEQQKQLESMDPKQTFSMQNVPNHGTIPDIPERPRLQALIAAEARRQINQIHPLNPMRMSKFIEDEREKYIRDLEVLRSLHEKQELDAEALRIPLDALNPMRMSKFIEDEREKYIRDLEVLRSLHEKQELDAEALRIPLDGNRSRTSKYLSRAD